MCVVLGTNLLSKKGVKDVSIRNVNQNYDRNEVTNIKLHLDAINNEGS